MTCEQYTRKKQRAMMQVLRRFYGQRSWKNVVSIGDGEYEEQALTNIGFERTNAVSSKTGQPKELRVKTVKLVGRPDVSQLRDQLQVLQAWLPRIISWRCDFSVDFGNESPVDMGFGH